MHSKALATLIVAAFLIVVIHPAVQAQRGQQVQLPEGPGRELVQTNCTGCHGLNLIANSWGYTREGWQNVFSTMVALPGDQANVVAGYLASNFPVKPAPEVSSVAAVPPS